MFFILLCFDVYIFTCFCLAHLIAQPHVFLHLLVGMNILCLGRISNIISSLYLLFMGLSLRKSVFLNFFYTKECYRKYFCLFNQSREVNLERY